MKRSRSRQLFTRPVARLFRKAPRRVLLDLEVLEDRTVPSAFNLITPLDDGSGGTLPGAQASGSGHTINFHPGAVPVEVMGPQGKMAAAVACKPSTARPC